MFEQIGKTAYYYRNDQNFTNYINKYVFYGNTSLLSKKIVRKRVIFEYVSDILEHFSWKLPVFYPHILKSPGKYYSWFKKKLYLIFLIQKRLFQCCSMENSGFFLQQELTFKADFQLWQHQLHNVKMNEVYTHFYY